MRLITRHRIREAEFVGGCPTWQPLALEPPHPPNPHATPHLLLVSFASGRHTKDSGVWFCLCSCADQVCHCPDLAPGVLRCTPKCPLFRQSGEECGPGGTLPLVFFCSMPLGKSLISEREESGSLMGLNPKKRLEGATWKLLLDHDT